MCVLVHYICVLSIYFVSLGAFSVITRISIALFLDLRLSFPLPTRSRARAQFVELFFFAVLFAFNSKNFFASVPFKIVYAMLSLLALNSIQVDSVNPSNHHRFKITMKEIGSFFFSASIFIFNLAILRMTISSLLSHASCLFPSLLPIKKKQSLSLLLQKHLKKNESFNACRILPSTASCV